LLNKDYRHETNRSYIAKEKTNAQHLNTTKMCADFFFCCVANSITLLIHADM
jgi:hypothetical protein